MSFKPQKIVLTTALLLSCNAALAIPFSSFDSRSMAMGGAGVAVGAPDAAPLFNPALLSISKESDKFALILPTIGVRFADPDNLRDSVDSFQANDYAGKLQTSVTNLNTAITTATTSPSSSTIAAVGTNAATVSTDLNNLSTQLSTLSNKPIMADGGVATVAALPSKNFGVAFYANGSAAVGGLFLYKDAPLVQTLTTNANCVATAAAMPTTTPAEVTAAATALAACTPPSFTSNDLKSGVNFRGVVLGELGFSLSHEFMISNHSVSFGLTPKIVKATLFDAPINVNNSDQNNITGADYIAEYSIANFDLGAAKNYDNGWSTGIVIKNVIPYSLEFKNAPTPGTTPVANGHTLKLSPLARFGVAHSNGWSTVAIDMDLTRNDPAGLEQPTQYIALGGELNAFNWAQLRAGYRIDMVDSARNVTSVGLGFSPFGVVHADLAVAGNGNEVGASFQLGVHF